MPGNAGSSTIGRVEGAPGMLVEVAADHLAILRPIGKRDGRAVYADEAFAVVVDKRQEVGLLFGRHFERSAGIKHDGIEIIQILGVVFQLFLGEHFRIGANGGVPQSALATQALNGRHGVGVGLVAVAFFLAQHQHAFSRHSRGLGQGRDADHGQQCRNHREISQSHRKPFSRAKPRRALCWRQRRSVKPLAAALKGSRRAAAAHSL